MWRKVVSGPAPSEAAASSISRSSSSSTGCTVRITNGSVTNRSATRTAARLKAMSMPTGPLGPYSASSVRPATIVGSANGRSMIALTTLWPQKRSRTRIQATIVPMTALIRQTASETTSVSFSAATACGSVTASQKPVCPAFPACQTSAASGRRTIRLRYAVTNETPSHGPGHGTAAGRGRLSARELSSAALPALDLRHDPVARVEELLVDLRPAAEPAGSRTRPAGTGKVNPFAALRSTGR